MLDVRLFQLVILGIVAGCTAQPAKVPSSNSASAAGPDVQCHVVPLTGSMISKTVCTTKADRDTQKADVNDLRNAVQTQGTGACRQNCVGGQ